MINDIMSTSAGFLGILQPMFLVVVLIGFANAIFKYASGGYEDKKEDNVWHIPEQKKIICAWCGSDIKLDVYHTCPNCGAPRGV